MNRRDDLAAVAFSGKDAATFLHNQLTQDVRSLAPGAATFAALCQPKGRVIALLMVGATEDGLRVLCRASLADGLVSHLARFVFRDQVHIERLAGINVASGARPAPIHGGGASASRAPLAFEPLAGFHYALYGDSQDAAEASAVDAESAAAPGLAADEEAQRIEAERARELERGIAWLDPRTSEQFLPQMLGHDAIGALNFRKGCFPGQEVIARTRYLGKLKRHPWSGQLDRKATLEPMDEVLLLGGDQQASAVLVEQRRRADGAWQALCVARRAEPFTVNLLDMADGGHAARGHWLNDAPSGAVEPPAGR